MLRLYYGSVKALLEASGTGVTPLLRLCWNLLRLCYGALIIEALVKANRALIEALLRLCYGSIKALLRLY